MKTWRLCVGLAACILLVVCAGGCGSNLIDDVKPARSMPVTSSEFEGVILLPGDWVPTVDQVLALEEQLVTYLPQHQTAFDSLQAPIVERLPTYTRQYWGDLENEKRVIVVNLFCDPLPFDWTEQVVSVLDGGDCYFRLQYDVEAETFFNLIVNGSS